MEKINLFEVKFWEEGKPQGTRSFQARNYDSYEKILFNCVLSGLCMRKYHTEYEWFMLNEHVFIKRINANSHICEYRIQLYDMFNREKFICDFNVEIHTITYCYPDGEDYLKMLLSEEKEYQKKESQLTEKDNRTNGNKKLTKWVLEESSAIRWFLIQLINAGSLKNLQKEMNKATYYRNLKECREKGYIEGDKLKRKVYY